MPRLGFGVWQIPDGPETERAVRWALDAGYRLLDTAQAYRNEASVGRALTASGTDRDQVFVTTKFDPARADPVAEADAEDLERLGIDRLDLYLVHWPQGGPTRAWAGMERALSLGLTKAIGVSNYERDPVEDRVRARRDAARGQPGAAEPFSVPARAA